MKTKTVLAISLIAVLVGCNKSSDDEKDKGVQNGLCTQETVSAYNDIGYYTDTVAIARSCSKLQSLLGDRSCKAENLRSGAETTISFSSVSSKCGQQSSTTGQNSYSDSYYKPEPAAPVDPAVDSAGRCRQAVIDVNNNLVRVAQSVRYASAAQFQSLVTSAANNCDKLSELLKGRSCEASSVDYSYSRQYISEDKFKDFCAKAKEANEAKDVKDN